MCNDRQPRTSNGSFQASGAGEGGADQPVLVSEPVLSPTDETALVQRSSCSRWDECERDARPRSLMAVRPVSPSLLRPAHSFETLTETALLLHVLPDSRAMSAAASLATSRQIAVLMEKSRA